jgi:hypothetical protein
VRNPFKGLSSEKKVQLIVVLKGTISPNFATKQNYADAECLAKYLLFNFTNLLPTSAQANLPNL